MNRRSFFRLGAGMAGAVAVAPKALLGAVPAPVVADVAPVVTIAGFAGNVFGLPSDFNFYAQLIKLCQQFFGDDGFLITERLQPGIVDIQAPTLAEEDLSFFKKGLFYIRPIGVMVNLNGQSALLPYDFYEARC